MTARSIRDVLRWSAGDVENGDSEPRCRGVSAVSRDSAPPVCVFTENGAVRLRSHVTATKVEPSRLLPELESRHHRASDRRIPASIWRRGAVMSRVAMSLLHPALLSGLVLAIVPIVLHLLLRAKPKRLIFPALRLLQLRRVQNTRRLQLRHLWLLLLRVLVIAALVIALCRPSLPPADYALQSSEILRLAGLIALGLAAYFSVLAWWSRQRLSQHVLRTRRTMLRGGVGLATALLALLFVGWPYQRRVAAEMKSPAPAALSNLPVAAVFLFDTSASLQYQFEGVSRLEAARRIGQAHLQRLPPGSKAAVLDGAGELPSLFTPDLSAAQNRLGALSHQPVTPALNERLREALRLQDEDRRRTLADQAGVAAERQQDKYVREVYLLTDLAKSAWRDDAGHALRDELASVPWVGLYLIDVGVESPTNVGFTTVQPARPAIAKGGTIVVEGTVRGEGAIKSEQMVELWVQSDEHPATKRDQQVVAVESGTTAGVRFQVDGLTGRLAQGELRLVSSDPLTFDNSAPFTVRILPPLEVLIVVDEKVHAQFLLEALNGLNATGTAYHPTVVLSSQLLSTNLGKFDVACLVHVARPPREAWDKLKSFVETGGGLWVCLGAKSAAVRAADASALFFNRGELDPLAYNAPVAQELLPAKLVAWLKLNPAQQLYFRGANHPLVARLEKLGVFADLNEVDFHQCWIVEPHESALVLARWNSASTPPALMIREVGAGRAVLFGCSIDSTAWSELLRRWPFVVITDQILQLLSRQASSSLNFLIGDPVVAPLMSNSPSGQALLRLPDQTQRRVEIPQGARELDVPPVTLAGNYQILLAEKQPPELLTGFSVRPLPAESDLRRLAPADLDDLLGEKRYSVAHDPQQLERSVTTGRLGQEVYGLVLTLLILIFVGEQTTATWFYRADEP